MKNKPFPYDTYPLTTAQNNILTMAQYYSGTSLCNIGGTIEFDIEGLTFEVIEKTLNHIIKEMDGFRIRITKQEEQFKQYFSYYEAVSIPYIDMREKSDTQIDEYVTRLMSTPIDLLESPLYRFNIIQRNELLFRELFLQGSRWCHR